MIKIEKSKLCGLVGHDFNLIALPPTPSLSYGLVLYTWLIFNNALKFSKLNIEMVNMILGNSGLNRFSKRITAL